jgi:hypothetical protein
MAPQRWGGINAKSEEATTKNCCLIDAYTHPQAFTTPDASRFPVKKATRNVLHDSHQPNSIAKLRMPPKLVTKNSLTALFTCQRFIISEVISSSKNYHLKTPPNLNCTALLFWIHFHQLLLYTRPSCLNYHTFMQFFQSIHPLLRGMESFYIGVLLCLSRTNNLQKLSCTRCQPSLWRHKEEQDVLVLKQENEGSFPVL